MANNNQYQAKFGADGSDFNRGIDSMLRAIKKLDDDTLGVSTRMSDAFKSPIALFTAGSAAAAAGFAYLAKTSIDAADKLDENAQKIGITASSLSTLQYAAKMSGLEIETLHTGLTKLSVKIAETNNVSSETGKVFKALGISTKDSMGAFRTVDSVLIDLADKFSQLPDGVQKTSLAVNIFGKSGAQLIPILNQGKNGIESLRAEARKLGLEINDNVAKAAGDFNDNLDRLKNAGIGLSNQVMTGLMPAMLSISNAMAGAAASGSSLEIAARGIGIAFKGIVSTAVYAYVGVMDVVTSFEMLGKSIVAFAKNDIAAMQTASIQSVDRMKQIAAEANQTLSKIWSNGPNQATQKSVTDASAAIDAFTQKTVTAKKSYLDMWGSDLVAKENIGFLTILTKTNIALGELVYLADQGAKGLELVTSKIQTPKEMQLYDTNSIEHQQMQNDLQQSNEEILKTQEVFSSESIAAYNAMFGDMGSAMSNFYDLSGQKSKEFFAISKAFQMGQAAMSTYEMAVNSYNSLSKIPFVGPYLGAAAAAAATVFGMSNVAKIASAQPGGAVSSTGQVALPNTSAPVQIPENVTNTNSRTVNITIYGSVVDPDKFTREIIPSIQRAIGDGYSFA